MNNKINADSSSDLPPTADAPQSVEPIGSMIGPYKLLQVIGEGGMGTVYLAQQERPVRRRVALKIIKLGMDTKHVVARFEAERQALSMMEHPNIARALDVGATDTGRPYFVMELVKGLAITRYCDEKRLTVNERLELFKAICNAVQHAHQKGIIHRDLKPSNILVAEYDKQAVPKIIDFGLAKALHQPLTDKTMFTRLGQVVGTLEYLSPEQSQMSQLDVDTRADIYSLGVLLYELLTGSLPLDRARLRSMALDQVHKLIREEEPPKPSTRLSRSGSSETIAANRQIESKRLGSLLRGDLDWIVMKAMDKDRNRRYESANGLGMDIQHFLQGDPVTAAPPSAGYRLRKFAKRNRVAVVVSSLVAMALVVAVVGTSAGMAWALAEKGRANQQSDLARQAQASAQNAQKTAEEAHADALYAQYVSNIPAANSFLNDNSTILARNTLTRTPPEHRNYEWAVLVNRAWPVYPMDDRGGADLAADDSASSHWKVGRTHILREIIPSNVSGGLNSGQFSPDGESVFLALAAGAVKRFSVATGDELARYTTPGGVLLATGVCPDGEIVGGFTFSSRLSLWDVETQTRLMSHPDSVQLSPPWIFRWTPDKRYVISSHMGSTIRIWDTNSPDLKMVKQWHAHDKDAMDLFVSTEGDFLITASLDKTLRKWSLPDGEPMGVYSAPTSKEIEFQGISPTGKMAVTVCAGGSSFLWNIETGEKIHDLARPDSNPYDGDNRHAASFSRDESCVAVMTGRLGATVFDVATGKPLNSIEGHGYPLRSIQLAPNGDRLLTISEDNRARIWGCVPEQPTELARAHSDIIFQIDINTAGTRLLAGSFDTTASVWNLQTQQRETVYTGHDSEIIAVDFSPNGVHAASLDALGGLHVWEITTGEPLLAIEPKSNDFAKRLARAGGGLRKNVLNFPAVLSTGLFTPDGSRVVAFQNDSMKVFDAQTGDVLAVLEDANFSGWPVFSHDSALVAVLELSRQEVGVWDIRTGEFQSRLVGNREHLVMLDFSPVDNRLVTSIMDSKITIWDASSGRKVRELDEPAGAGSSCRFSSDGQFLLVGYSDSTARVFDSTTGELVTTLVGHNSRVRDVRLSPDGTRLLSWGMDNKAMIWDFHGSLSNQLLVLGGDSKLLQAHWTPDGRDIVAAWSDGRIDVWSGATQEDIAQLDDTRTLADAFEQWRPDHMNVTTN